MSGSAAVNSSSVLASEIAQFEALAGEWWNPTGHMAPLHRMNSARLAFITAAVTAHWPQKDNMALQELDVLDLGCGAGLLSEPLARLGARVTGVDAAPAVLQVARQHAESQGLLIDYREGSVETLAAASAKFDLVCALEIIEHVTDPAAFAAAAADLVRPGGMIIFSTLNRTRKSFALGIVAAEHVLRWVPVGTHHWEKFVMPSELAGWLRSLGFRLQRLSGVVYDPLTRDFSLRDHKLDVNYLLAAVRDAPLAQVG